jgi:hypothetical protein
MSTDTTINTTFDDLEDRMWRLYFNSRVGMGAAEYNLEEAGMIEMENGHVAGIFIEGRSNGWCDCRWVITDRGNHTTLADLERIMLADPPLEIAVMDARLEADIVADDLNDTDHETLADDRRTLAALEERAESIRSKMRLALSNTKDIHGDYFQPRRNLVALNERVESIVESIRRPAHPHA